MKANTYIAKALTVIDELDLKGQHIPLLLLSHPGFGKTSTIAKWCEYKDYNLITLIASQYSADDVLGIQSVKGGKLVRLTPSWFNRMKEIMKNGKRTVLFLDEISTCDSYMTAPLLNLIFNHDLGEEKLPDNVLIISAGNYSEDLNNNFKLDAPTLNRFLLLNLWTSDFDIDELLDNTFEKLNSKKDIEEYFELRDDKKMWDFEVFKEWIKKTDEISFGNGEITEDPEFGLLGFTSVRSLNYSLKFAEAFINHYSSTLWMRIVGDTLGKSLKREGKLLRVTIENNSSLFSVDRVEVSKINIKTLRDKLINSSEKISSEDIDILHTYVKTIDLNTITSKEIGYLTDIFKSHPNDKDLDNISKELTRRIKG